MTPTKREQAHAGRLAELAQMIWEAVQFCGQGEHAIYQRTVALENAWRKMDDKSSSALGNTGTRLGHRCWSKSAKAMLDANGGRCTSEVKDFVRVEHVITINWCLRNIFFTLPKFTTVNEIKQLMLVYGQVAIITRKENALLRANGMPDGWVKTDTSTKNIFARYVEANLFKELEFH